MWWLLWIPLLLLMIIVGFYAIVFTFFAVLAGYWGVRRCIEEAKFYRKLRAAGRSATMTSLNEHAVASGTFIVVLPYLGCNTSRLWWAPEIIDESTRPPEQKRLEFERSCAICLWDRWCWTAFCEPCSGKATLLRSWSGHRLLKQVIAAHPSARSLHVESYWWKDDTFDRIIVD